MAASPLTETDYIRVSTEAAETFTDAFYTALNAASARPTLTTFYMPPITQPSGRSLPHISINGDLIPTPAAFQARFTADLPFLHYAPTCLNAHVLNRCLTPLPEGCGKQEAERNMSLLVQVGGTVRVGERKEGPLRGFSESFILVPNKEAVGGKGTKGQDQGRRWVVQSQTFRLVV